MSDDVETLAKDIDQNLPVDVVIGEWTIGKLAENLHALGYRLIGPESVVCPREPTAGMVGALLDVGDISEGDFRHLIAKWTPRIRAMLAADLSEIASPPNKPRDMSAMDCNNCHACLKDKKHWTGFPVTGTRMVTCPSCGNKRCPKASDHNLACTNSNEPGQPGSIYSESSPPNKEPT